MSYLARSSSSEIPNSSGIFAATLPAGAGSARGAPSRPVPRAVERSRAIGSVGSRPTEMPSLGPAPGACGTSPAFSSALRTASSSAALFSTSACASASSSDRSSGFWSSGFCSVSRAASGSRALSPQGSSCARTADATKTAASTVAIAERNLSLLLAAERSVKVHTDAHRRQRPEQESPARRAYFSVSMNAATARRVCAGFSSWGMWPQPASGPLSAREYGAVVIACAEEMAREHRGKVVLIGNSLGGALALYAAHERPDLCAGVVGMNPAGAELSDEAMTALPRAFDDPNLGAAHMARLLFHRTPWPFWLVARDFARHWGTPTVQRILDDARAG
ncbi:MAG: alpha/beta hydrolase, partial [Deltaproteobacteria bacterium]